MRDRDKRTAERFNILTNIKKLERELLNIDGVVSVEYDLDGFWDNINQVIFLTEYDINVTDNDFYDKRRELISEVIHVAADNGLYLTGDRIEDYGQHLYFVFGCNDEWLKNKEKEIA